MNRVRKSLEFLVDPMERGVAIVQFLNPALARLGWFDSTLKLVWVTFRFRNLAYGLAHSMMKEIWYANPLTIEGAGFR